MLETSMRPWLVVWSMFTPLDKSLLDRQEISAVREYETSHVQASSSSSTHQPLNTPHNCVSLKTSVTVKCMLRTTYIGSEAGNLSWVSRGTYASKRWLLLKLGQSRLIYDTRPASQQPPPPFPTYSSLSVLVSGSARPLIFSTPTPCFFFFAGTSWVCSLSQPPRRRRSLLRGR